MNIAILGTGTVGRTLADKLNTLGHHVVMGTRDPDTTKARNEPDNMGNPGFADWYADHAGIALASFADAVAGADLIFGALSGSAMLPALATIGAKKLAGKTLVDLSNPLDFSNGFPPSLTVANTNSLGEQIQTAYPETKVVKALNMVASSLMVDPQALANGDHSVCISGNDNDAKARVTALLTDEFGWKDVIDLGGIESARATEAVLLIWTRLFGVLQTPHFGIKIVR